VDHTGFGKQRWRAGFKKRGLKLTNIVICCIYKNKCIQVELPHRNKSFIKDPTLQELSHQCDAPN
jgi:hypothetical protein